LIETNPSPIEKITFRDRDYFVKRDDLLHKHFSGNKARKFHYFLTNDFPKIETLISHGSAQSNAMYSLSVLAKMRGWKFLYYVDHLPSYLVKNPIGNYKEALANGMQIILGKPDRVYYHDSVLFIPEGGAMDEAKAGIRLLADEINSAFCGKKIDIFLPSGTGTTALFLQKYTDFKVYTTPCVGDEKYLEKQFLALESVRAYHPTILNSEKKYHFGKLYREFFEIWVELKECTKIEFDLLYDPKGWLALLANASLFDNELLYIHQGGLLGNESMLQRYGRKFHEDYRA
jgi:1-aminocyclopropane-1-carboxylate deaminase/D-cysteine desulfhydrase-like pyridoxal-dependent ACC family enzyme